MNRVFVLKVESLTSQRGIIVSIEASIVAIAALTLALSLSIYAYSFLDGAVTDALQEIGARLLALFT